MQVFLNVLFWAFLLILSNNGGSSADNTTEVALRTQQLVDQAVRKKKSNRFQFRALRDLHLIISEPKVRSQVSILGLDDVLGTDQAFERYLKQSRYDVGKAVSRIESTAQWRRNNNIDNLILDDVSLLSVSLPYECTGKTEDGNPVFYIPLGKWNLRKVQRDRQNPRLQTYLIQLFEFSLKTASKQTNPRTQGGPVSQSVFIIDLNGLSPRNLLSGWGRTVRTLYQAARTYEAHYPNTVKSWYIVRAPKRFLLVWRLLSRFVPGDILSTVNVYSRWSIRWRNELRSHIPKEAIPKELNL